MSRYHSCINKISGNSHSALYPLVSVLLLILALPWVGFGPIALVALVPLFLFLADTHVSRRRAYVLGGGVILIYMLFAVYPLMRVEGTWWVGTRGLHNIISENTQYLLLVILTAVWHALIFMPVLFMVRKRITRAWGVPLTALTWMLFEWGLTNVALWGYSIGILGYSLVDVPYVKDIASFSGVYGLSFVVVYVNALITHVILRNKQVFVIRQRTSEYSITYFLGLFFAIVVFSLYHERPEEERGTMRVALIGTSLSTDASIGSAGYALYKEKLLSAFTHNPDLVLFPENAFPYFEINESDGTLVKNSLINFPARDELYQDLLALSRVHAATTLAIGLHTYREGKHYNSIVFYKGGTPVRYYEKRVLVPFTEYVPFGLLIPMYVRFAHGGEDQQIEMNGISWNALICSEVGDTNISLRKGDPILVASNDSIFLGTAAATMHHQMAKMRAIEQHAYLLRATKGGVTSIIDPYGNVLLQATDGVLIGNISVRPRD